MQLPDGEGDATRVSDSDEGFQLAEIHRSAHLLTCKDCISNSIINALDDQGKSELGCNAG